MEIDAFGDVLNPEIQASLDVFKKEYDKGARMNALGIGGGRKEKGQLMMDLAWQKMQTLNKHLGLVEEQMAAMQDGALNEMGEEPTHGDKVKWNEGASNDQFENASRLASGAMLGNLKVNPKTGEILYLTQGEADTSDESYQAYKNDNIESPNSPEYTGEIMLQEDWAAQQELPEAEETLFSKIDFPTSADGSIQPQYTGLITAQTKAGLDGQEFDAEAESLVKLDLEDKFNNASENALRSFLFGGKLTVFDEASGELKRVVPAHKMLMDRGADPGDPEAEPGSEAHNNYLIFQGKLEDLKTMDFSKQGGAKTRQEMIDMVSDSAKHHHQRAYDKYTANKEEKMDAQSNQANKRYVTDQTLDDNDKANKINKIVSGDITVKAIKALDLDLGPKTQITQLENGTISIMDAQNNQYLIDPSDPTAARSTLYNLSDIGTRSRSDKEIEVSEEKQNEITIKKNKGLNSGNINIGGELISLKDMPKDTYTYVDGKFYTKKEFVKAVQFKLLTNEQINEGGKTATKIQNKIG